MLPLTDSTIAPPPKTSDFFNERFVAAQYKEGCYEKQALTYFLVREGLSTDDVGVARGTTVFQETRPWAAFKIGDFVEESLGEATVERLPCVLYLVITGGHGGAVCMRVETPLPLPIAGGQGGVQIKIAPPIARGKDPTGEKKTSLIVAALLTLFAFFFWHMCLFAEYGPADSHSRGLFAGLSLEGGVIVARPDVNRKFYGREVSARWVGGWVGRSRGITA